MLWLPFENEISFSLGLGLLGNNPGLIGLYKRPYREAFSQNRDHEVRKLYCVNFNNRYNLITRKLKLMLIVVCFSSAALLVE